MTTVEFEDRAGCKLKVMEFQGRHYPLFPLEEIQAYPSIPIRDDDIILCAYPKSGTHWLWEVTMMLLGQKAETIPYKKSLQMIEFNASKLADFPSPRVLNTHMPYDALPEQVRSKGTRLLFILRNPKDVAVSLYNHHLKLSKYYGYSGAFGDWLELFLDGKVDFGSWFDYVRSWEKVLDSGISNQIHVIMYEDMKMDPLTETQRLAQFLGVPSDPKLIEKVAAKCDFSKMAEDKKAYQDHAEIMFRKGLVGDWKEVFTVAQNEAFDSILADKMGGSRFTFKYTLT